MIDRRGLTITTPSDREIVLSRTFDAPRALVFDAFTKPEFLRRWLGVHGGWSLDVCDIDLRVGGGYRYVWKNVNGMEMGMRGWWREVSPPDRLVSKEQFDQAWYEGECISTVTFVEHNGKTTLTMTLLYDTKAIRDAVLASPMESGIAAGYNTLEQLLASLRS